jgi:hypothetical protein
MPELTAAALRLLQMLAVEGAYGFHPEPDEPGILAVVGQSNGISLRRASATVVASKELERGGLARWQTSAQSRRRRFILTDDGWAKLVEIASMAGGVAFSASEQRQTVQAEAEICP